MGSMILASRQLVSRNPFGHASDHQRRRTPTALYLVASLSNDRWDSVRNWARNRVVVALAVL